MNEKAMKQLNAVVAEHLPQAIGEELRKRLDKVDELTSEVTTLSRKLTKACKDRDSFESTIEGLREEIEEDRDKHGNLSSREDEVNRRETRQELSMQELRAEEANKRADVAFSLVNRVFGTPEIVRTRKTDTETPVVMHHYQYNSQTGQNDIVTGDYILNEKTSIEVTETEGQD